MNIVMEKCTGSNANEWHEEENCFSFNYLYEPLRAWGRWKMQNDAPEALSWNLSRWTITIILTTQGNEEIHFIYWYAIFNTKEECQQYNCSVF